MKSLGIVSLHKIKIVYIIDKLILAGAQTQLVHLLCSIDRAKYDILLICTDGGGELGKNLVAASVPYDIIGVDNWNSLKGIKGFYNLCRLLKKASPDIVHTYLFTPNVFGVLAAKISTRAKIISSRRDLGDWMSARQVALCNFSNRFVNYITANSEAVGEAARLIENTRGKPIRITYNAVRNYNNMPPKDEFDLENKYADRILIGTLSNIRLEKDPMTLLRAFLEVVKNEPKAFLLYAGGVKDQQLFKEMKRWLREHNIENSVCFLGQISNVKGFLRALDIFVFSSQSEGFSNAVLEALSCSLPVVASKAGGNVEQIVHAKTGYLFDVGDHDACAKYTLSLMALDLRQQMGREAGLLVESKFSTLCMIKTFDALYQEVSAH